MVIAFQNSRDDYYNVNPYCHDYKVGINVRATWIPWLYINPIYDNIYVSPVLVSFL